MTALLLETATETCSVALFRDGELLAELTADAPHQHASLLNVFIDQLLQSTGLTAKDIDVVGLSEGPGSYTSLRVGAALAKGLCLALPHIKLYPLSSLQALAREVWGVRKEPVIATQRSRRDEVYALLFDPNEKSTHPARALSVEDPVFAAFLQLHPYVTICGTGTAKLAAAVARPDDHVLDGSESLAKYLYPELLLRLEQGVAPADLASFEPLYLKPPFVTVSKKRSLL